jgi:hypothetical protein
LFSFLLLRCFLMLVGHFICLSHTCKCLLCIMSYHKNLGLVCSLKMFIKKNWRIEPKPKIDKFYENETCYNWESIINKFWPRPRINKSSFWKN